MLRSGRTSTQTILKAAVTTSSTVFEESVSNSVEQIEMSNESDSSEPLAKKFKNDNQEQVNMEMFVNYSFKPILFSGRNVNCNNSSSNKTSEKTKSLCLIRLLWYVLNIS